MMILVDGKETLDILVGVCAAACKTGNLNIAKCAVNIVESVSIKGIEDGKDKLREIIRDKRTTEGKTEVEGKDVREENIGPSGVSEATNVKEEEKIKDEDKENST